jgi:hypothetical protein
MERDLFVRRCFLQQIHLGDDHPSTTVSLNIKAVKDLFWGFFWLFTSSNSFLVHLTAFFVLLIQRGNDLAAGKTSNWDNHPSSPV